MPAQAEIVAESGSGSRMWTLYDMEAVAWAVGVRLPQTVAVALLGMRAVPTA